MLLHVQIIVFIEALKPLWEDIPVSTSSLYLFLKKLWCCVGGEYYKIIWIFWFCIEIVDLKIYLCSRVFPCFRDVGKGSRLPYVAQNDRGDLEGLDTFL